MSEPPPQGGPALSLALFDPARGLSVSARAGTTLLFRGREANVLPDGPAIEPSGEGWTAELEGALSLELVPLAPAASLGPLRARICRVQGSVGADRVDCLGTVAETLTAPAWNDLDVLRSVTAIVDEGNAFLALGRRPRGAPGHDEELTLGWLLIDGEPHDVEDTRISTVYDGEGRQRAAGLELWLPGEDLPRRGSGMVTAGSSLDLGGLDVHVAAFSWRMAERDGAGAYELWARPAEPEAA